MSDQKKTSILAILSVVCAFTCLPFGILFGVIALIQISRSKGELGGKTLAIIGLCVSLGLGLPALGIVSIMAASVMPNVTKFQCRAKQSEAKVDLKGIYIAEEGYRGEYDKYGSLEEIGYRDSLAKPRPGSKSRYEFSIIEATKTTFKAQAVGISGDMQGDIWVIDENNNLVALNNACQ